MILLMLNSSTRENKAELVSRKHTFLFRVLSLNIKMHKKFWTPKSKNCSKNKTMSNGKLKTQPSSSKFTPPVTISKRPSNTCCPRRPNKCKSCGMSPSILSSSFSTRLGEPSCWITSRAEKTFWTSASNILDTWARTSRSGASSSSFTVTLTTRGSQRMTSTTETSLLAKNLTGKCWLITSHCSRVKWEI